MDIFNKNALVSLGREVNRLRAENEAYLVDNASAQRLVEYNDDRLAELRVYALASIFLLGAILALLYSAIYAQKSEG